MAAARLLQVLAAAGRARAAAVAMGRRRCPLPRQPLGAHPAVLGLGRRAVTPPSSLVPPFSTNAVEDEGEDAAIAGRKDASIAAGKGASSINWRFKAADADAAAHKKKTSPFDPLGTGNDAEAEEDAEVGAGEMAVKARPFGATAEEEGGEGAGDVFKADDGGVVAGDILKEEQGSGDIVKEQGGGKGAGAIVTEEKGGEGAGDMSSCLYDEDRLRAFMDSLLVGKCIVDVPQFTESLEQERIKHNKESVHSERRHIVLMVIGIILKLIVLAVFKYLQIAKMNNRMAAKKKRDQEVVKKKRDQEVVMVDKKKIEEKIEETVKEKEEKEDKQEEEGSGAGSLLLLVFLLFII